MSFKFGPLTVGSPYAENKAKQGLQQQSGIADMYGNLAKTYLPPAVANLQKEYDTSPAWLNQS